MGYATVMLMVHAERGDPGLGGGACQACHGAPMPQQDTFNAWGGFAHAPVDRSFPGVPSGFRM